MEREGEEFEKENRLWQRVGMWFTKRGERRVEGMLPP